MALDLIATLKGHTGAVFSAEFSADASRIVTASGDGTARLWTASAESPPAEVMLREALRILPRTKAFQPTRDRYNKRLASRGGSLER